MRRCYSLLRLPAILALMIVFLTAPKLLIAAPIQSAIVEAKPQVNTTTLFAQYGVILLDSIPELNKYLVSGNQSNLQALSKDPNVVSIEYDIQAVISETAMLNESTVALLDPDTVALLDGQGSLWNSQQPNQSTILMQPDFKSIGFAPTNQAAQNPVTIAVIDTGVDPNHEMLLGSTLPGQNFINASISTNELLDLDPTTAALLLQAAGRSGLNEAVLVFVNPATVAMLEQTVIGRISATPYFGHGTLVSGLIHAIAPTATILPLKAFGPSGIATSFPIAKAIVYAADHGVAVINMSFNLASYSALVDQAVQYAANRNIVLVAALGNTNSKVDQGYPASYSKVIGVAATDLNNLKASFSNYGGAAAIAAPGDALISSYPGSLYASWSGTSAAAALVSAEAAFLLSHATLTADQVTNLIEQKVDQLNDPPYQLGKGRIDLQSAAAAVSPSNQPSSVSSCTGNCSVPAGTTLSSMTVAPAGNLIVYGAVMGDVNLQAGATLQLMGGSVGGNVQLNSGGNIAAQGGTIKGNLQDQGAGSVKLDSTTSIGGNVQLQGATLISIAGSIAGNLEISNTSGSSPSSNYVCGAHVTGNLQLQGSSAQTTFYLGGGPQCAGGNMVGGNVQVQQNQGPVTVSDNTITHNLQCQQNTSISSSSNIVAGNKQGQCLQ